MRKIKDLKILEDFTPIKKSKSDTRDCSFRK